MIIKRSDRLAAVPARDNAPVRALVPLQQLGMRPHVDASKDGELSGGLPVTPPRSMGFGLAVATIVQFQTAAMLIMCPFMFGLLGLLLGAICVTLWFGVSTYISVRMAEVSRVALNTMQRERFSSFQKNLKKRLMK